MSQTPEEEEKKKLSIPPSGIQWNTALYGTSILNFKIFKLTSILLDDSCLIVVPGSHNRVRNQNEHRITLEDPKGPIPDQLTVDLKVGQTLFYNSRILHRAVYLKDRKRVTLHGCMGSSTGSSNRAQGILQHDLEWMRSEEFRKSLPVKMHSMLNNLIKLADEHENVGFVHPNNC
jgi:hypothetical protein